MLMTSFGLKRFTGVLYLLAWYSPHEAVTARQAPFRTRRGSGTRLMRHVLISAHTRGIFAQWRAFTAGAKDARRFRLSIGERTPKKIVQKGSVRVDRR